MALYFEKEEAANDDIIPYVELRRGIRAFDYSFFKGMRKPYLTLEEKKIREKYAWTWSRNNSAKLRLARYRNPECTYSLEVPAKANLSEQALYLLGYKILKHKVVPLAEGEGVSTLGPKKLRRILYLADRGSDGREAALRLIKKKTLPAAGPTLSLVKLKSFVQKLVTYHGVHGCFPGKVRVIPVQSARFAG